MSSSLSSNSCVNEAPVNNYCYLSTAVMVKQQTLLNEKVTKGELELWKRKSYRMVLSKNDFPAIGRLVFIPMNFPKIEIFLKQPLRP